MTDYLVTSKIRLFFQYFFIGLVFLITLIWLITSHKKDLRWIIQRVNITLQKNPYLIMIMLFSCAIPVVASAWLFSSASAQNPQDSNSFSDKNTQNVDLLTSQISMAGDQKPDDGIIIAMDDTALVPEIGPAGTLADVYDIQFNKPMEKSPYSANALVTNTYINNSTFSFDVYLTASQSVHLDRIIAFSSAPAATYHSRRTWGKISGYLISE